ncbi:MAG TPA: ATP-dependent DNA helicase RecG [Clostridiaceae bacterium]|nr:ATP-dependent DNA helicase RecG [Clostridiaceae bacterium]
MDINDSVSTLKGVGEKTAQNLVNMGIRTILDLMLYFPRSYEKLNEADVSFFNGVDKAVLKATMLKLSRPVRFKARSTMVTGYFSSDFGEVKATWFNMPYVGGNFKVGETYELVGKFLKKGKYLEVINPVTSKGDEGIVPKYPLAEKVTDHLLRKLVRQVFDRMRINENLPEDIIREESLMSLDEAIRNLHFPGEEDTLREALRRIKFQELFAYSLKIMIARKRRQGSKDGISFRMSPRLTDLKAAIPYELTAAQSRSIREILLDSKKPYPMNRLLQGDVGSGKTVVALITLFNAVENGYQGAFMVPTEILASQHLIEARKLLADFGIQIELLTGSTKKKERDRILADLEAGKPMLIIGTHALIEDDVVIRRLGFVVTDEQHRFGVNQRARLMNKNVEADVLVMSATPIPRTMALTLYSDLDISVIDELPPGRKNIQTLLFSQNKRAACYGKIREEIEKGRQAYVVTPLIEEDEESEVNSVEGLYKELKDGYLEGIPIGILHGRMSSRDKEKVMKEFNEDRIKVLVSTTVIEVGVNVRNASVMLIENAERFGLAQLHQLRGRVGRGEYQSYCIMVASISSEETRMRLETLVKSNDGFFIAEEDLRQRGTGQLFGMNQSGSSGLSVSDFSRDYEIFLAANRFAKRVFTGEKEEDLKVKEEFTKRLEENLSYICLN